MRTKTLLLTAALGIASAASSMAQAVYSVNVVGYVNLTLQRGFNLVSSQLDATPDNKIGSVLPTVPFESQVHKFSNNNFTRYDFIDPDGWVLAEDLSPVLPTVTLVPGEGFFFYNPSVGSITVTTVGQVRTGNGLSVPLASGYNVISGITPQDLTLNDTPPNTFPVRDQMQYFSHSAALQGFSPPLGLAYINDAGDPPARWVNAETLETVPTPTISVGQGVFIYNPGAATAWVRDFNPNTP